MPTNRPTEAEVRGLMAEYSRPDAPACRQCGKPTKHTIDCTGIAYFRCYKCGITMEVENKCDPEIVALCGDWLRLKEDSRYAEFGKGLFEAMDMAQAVRNAEELHNCDRTDAFIQVWSEQKRRIKELEARLAAIESQEPPHA